MYDTGVAFYGVLFLHDEMEEFSSPRANDYRQHACGYKRSRILCGFQEPGQYLACVEITMEKRSAASYFFDSAHWIRNPDLCA